jgi:hypothetical protein
MTGRIKGMGANQRYYLDGREVPREEFDRAFPPRDCSGGGGLVGFKPLHSDALCVHPAQREEAIEDAKGKGVPTEFDLEGRPVFTSSRHFRDYARRYGFRHKGY